MVGIRIFCRTIVFILKLVPKKMVPASFEGAFGCPNRAKIRGFSLIWKEKKKANDFILFYFCFLRMCMNFDFV